MTRKKVLIISIISFVLCVIGFIAIWTVISLNKPQAKIEDTKTELQSDSKEITSETKTPDAYTAKEAMQYTLWRMSNTDFDVKTSGSSNALGIIQKINNHRTVIGNEALISTVSTSSMKKVAKEKFFPGNGKVLLSDASSINVDDATAVFSQDEPQIITEEDYIGMYGWLPFQLCGYIISTETYLEEPTMVANENGTYTISVNLDPATDKAPFWYKREVLENSGSSIIPNFFSIKIDIVIDNTYRVLTAEYNESYEVQVFFKVTTNTYCKDTFITPLIQFTDFLVCLKS